MPKNTKKKQLVSKCIEVFDLQIKQAEIEEEKYKSISESESRVAWAVTGLVTTVLILLIMGV